MEILILYQPKSVSGTPKLTMHVLRPWLRGLMANKFLTHGYGKVLCQNSYFIPHSGVSFLVENILIKILKPLFCWRCLIFLNSQLFSSDLRHELITHAPSVLQAWLIISSISVCVRELFTWPFKVLQCQRYPRETSFRGQPTYLLIQVIFQKWAIFKAEDWKKKKKARAYFYSQLPALRVTLFLHSTCLLLSQSLSYWQCCNTAPYTVH